GGGGRGGGSGVASEVTRWVQEHGTAVEASAYGDTSQSTSDSDTDDGADNTSSVYRLDPADVE
uniref:hypothetical protein n=1 Tax=Streptomyces sp. IBSBF 2394 TaxID=2903532 RepID=UPI002FDBFB11